MRTALRTIVLAIREAWNPTTALFANGEVGVFYDCSDFSTMFQDSAGTTPVTAVEQPVGLMLDKSKGLVLGPELVTNGTFDTDTSGWSADDALLAASGGAITITNTNTYGHAYQIISTEVGKTYRVNYTVVAQTSLVSRFYILTPALITIYASATLTPGSYSVVFTAVGTTTRIGLYTNTVVVAETTTWDNISVKELPGNHAVQATSTKRPVLKQDGNGKYYLLFDGVDDALATGSIDFTSTDKMTVFAGVRKLSDAAIGIVAEVGNLSTQILGSVSLVAPISVAPNYNLTSRGSLTPSGATGSGFAAPITNVVTGISDISGDTATLRINGVQSAASAADQGTGNYGAYPLYIGSRGGTSLPFNGQIYSLIVRGAQSTTAQIVSAETWVNTRTGAY